MQTLGSFFRGGGAFALLEVFVLPLEYFKCKAKYKCIYTAIRLVFLFHITTTLSTTSSGSFSGISIAILIR